MYNKGIEAGPPLGLKNFRQGCGVKGVRAQAINGLGWKGYETAVIENFRRPLEGFRGNRKKLHCDKNTIIQRIHASVFTVRWIMVQYLLFDLDNTLYSSRYGLEDSVRQRIRTFSAAFLGIAPEEVWRQRMEYWPNYGTTLEWLINEKGLTDAEAYLAAVHPKDEADSLPPDPPLKAFLESIRIPKAILTNSPKEHADRILDKLGIAGLFTHIFDIRQCGFRGKPHPDVFNNALNVLGVQAADVLFIDDSPQYVKGFIAMGGKGLLLDENGVYNDYPHSKIRELKELKQYLAYSKDQLPSE